MGREHEVVVGNTLKKALVLALLFLAGCTPELEQASFVSRPPAGWCTANAVHLGHFWNPTLRFVTCTDTAGRMRDVPVGDQRSIREMLGPLSELWDKVVIPFGPVL